MSECNRNGNIKRKRITKSFRAGLQLPVSRIHRYLRKGKYAKRISVDAAVYLTGVVEYLVSELLHWAADVTYKKKKSLISPHSLQLTIKNDIEINELLSNITIAGGGVVPNIHPFLLQKRKKLKKK